VALSWLCRRFYPGFVQLAAFMISHELEATWKAQAPRALTTTSCWATIEKAKCYQDF